MFFVGVRWRSLITVISPADNNRKTGGDVRLLSPP